MKIRIEKVIRVSEWDALVEKTYGRIYSFQQQDGCRGRGIFRFEVPCDEDCDYERESVPEIVNHETMGLVLLLGWRVILNKKFQSKNMILT